jgi:ribonuclease VapC
VTAPVLDASALIALLVGEPGANIVAAALDGALVGSVNLAEVVSYYAKLGSDRSDIEAMLRPLPIVVVTADSELAYAAGMLRPLTLTGGLSLGDRYCLALAKREATRALTAERRWPLIAAVVGVEIEVIR